MPSSDRISGIAQSLKQLGEIQINDFDLKGLLATDVRDLEIGRSLKRLGRKKVMDWDFRTAVPAVKDFVQQEVDVVGWLKRVASYKVLELDFGGDADAATERDEAATAALVDRLRSFLMYLAVNLIEQPDRAQLRVAWITPDTVRFRLVLTAADQKLLVGRDGATASSIRGMMKAAASAEGVHLLLEIISQEDEIARAAKETTP